MTDVSPALTTPDRQEKESLLDEHFRLADLIHSYPNGDVSEKLELLCLSHIKIAPDLITSERRAAEMNHSEFFPVAHAGYNRLSAILFSMRRWQEVIRLHDEALAGGWNVCEMRDRVAAAESMVMENEPSKIA